MEQIKIRKTILSDSLQLEGLSPFLGQDVEILISPISKPVQPSPAKFIRFAGIAQADAALLEALEAEVEANRQLDLKREL